MTSELLQFVNQLDHNGKT